MVLQVIGTEDIDQNIGLSSPDSSQQGKRKEADITYGIDDIPPWYLCIFMALQVW
jgi:nucleobase transporter 1/2